MSDERIIEIPYKWIKTLNKHFYFEMFREMYFGTTQTMEETYYTLEEIRADMHLPPMYISYESFKRSYYDWIKCALSKESLPELP